MLPPLLASDLFWELLFHAGVGDVSIMIPVLAQV